MMKEHIRELVHASPFIPFTIHTASGKTYRIHHPDYILAGSDHPHVIVEELSGRIHTINIQLITSVEQESSSATA